jgi:hypothetical protein
MPVARDLVEDHAGDLDARIEARAAERHGGGRLRGSGHVDDEDHRPAEPRRNVGAGAGAAGLALDPVEQPHRAFRDDEINIRGRSRSIGREQRLVHREAVEVEARRPGRGAVKSRIDVVRAAFRAPDPQPAPGERALQA